MLEIIGAGFGRTGTLSLKFALEQLDFGPCYHMMEVRQHPDHRELWLRAHRGESVDWNALFDGYRATVDWPSCNMWRELATHCPDAKVILSVRDADRWYDSVMNTIYGTSAVNGSSDDATRREGAAWSHEIVWDRVFDGRMDDRAHVIDTFERHNAAVVAAVPADQLLVFQPNQGWDPLCEFLQVEVPDEDFPRVNSTEEFQELWSTDDD